MYKKCQQLIEIYKVKKYNNNKYKIEKYVKMNLYKIHKGEKETMNYKDSLDELKNEITNKDNSICLFIQTDMNIYSFTNRLTNSEQVEILKPIEGYLSDKEYSKYDSLERRPNTIYYITKGMEEYQSLERILEINDMIINNNVEVATIKSIDNDKIKGIILKKESFIFFYRYNTSKIFKQGFRARFDKEAAVVEKKNDSELILSKMIPDIVLDTNKEHAFLLNITQAEFILQIENLFKGSIQNIGEKLIESKLMKKEGIQSFIDEVSKKKNYLRKLHKIQTTKSYKYFERNKSKIPAVLEKYELNINFDNDTGEIIFNEETEVVDVLHLLADDYIIRYISEREDVIKI